MSDSKRGEGLALLGRSVSKQQQAGTAEVARAQVDVETVVQHFKEDPSAWKELKERLQRATNDDERARLLIDFAVSEDALRRLPGDPSGPVAATPTVTTVTVTTVTTV